MILSHIYGAGRKLIRQKNAEFPLSSHSRYVQTGLAVLLFTGLSSLAPAEVIRPFEVLHQANINGNIIFTGNTLMMSERFQDNRPPLALNNDQEPMVHINVDGDARTNKSSSAMLDIQPNSNVVFAGLFWGARLNDQALGELAWIKGENSEYQEVRAEWIASPAENNYYAAYADVTELVQQWGRGMYTVGNIGAQTGPDRFAGWSLVVIEENPIFPFRSITLFDGYASIPDQVDIEVDGFVAPRFGDFNASLGVVAYEGDFNHDGAQFLFNGEPLSDAMNPPNNFFNSGFTRYGERFTDRVPNPDNLLGFDIAQVDISGRLNNGDTSALLSFATNRDWYQPTAVSFMTDFNTDLDLNLWLDYPGRLAIGDVVTLVTEVTNTSPEPYESVAVALNVPVGTEYLADSTTLDWQPVSDAADDDFAERIDENLLEVRVPELRSGESRLIRYQVRLTEALRDHPQVRVQNSALFIIPELGSEALVLSDSDAERAGIQPARLILAELLTPSIVDEGTDYPVQIRLGDRLSRDLGFVLDNNRVIQVSAGNREGEVQLNAPAADPYITDRILERTITGTEAQPVADYPVMVNGVSGLEQRVRVQDVIATTTLSLSGQDTQEGSPGGVFTARVSHPPQTDLVLTLDALDEVIVIPAGNSSGQVRVPVRANDVYLGPENLTREIVNITGGNFEDLQVTEPQASLLVDDVIDPAFMSLDAEKSVPEGGQITYVLTLSHPTITELTASLSNNTQLRIPAGATTGSVTVPARADDVYQNAASVTVEVLEATSGGFERLIAADGGAGVQVTTSVFDVIDTLPVVLTTADVVETDTSVRFTAILPEPALSAVTITLDRGETIMILAGERTGHIEIPLPSNDPYRSERRVNRNIIDVRGGGFESLDYEDVGASALVSDVTDITTLSLSALDAVDEGAELEITARVDAPPQNPLTLSLNTGHSLVIPADTTEATVRLPAPANEPYINAHMWNIWVTEYRGGNFEQLTVSNTDESSALAVAVQDVIDQTTVELVTSDVTENDENLVFTAVLSNSAQTETRVTLDGGEQIVIQPGDSSGFTVVSKRSPDVYRSENQVMRRITALEGGNFESLVATVDTASAAVLDVADTTTLSLSANSPVKEGDTLQFRVRVDNPPQTTLTVDLNIGATLTIEPGAQEAVLELPAPEDDVYISAQTLTVSVVSTTGGNFETLAIRRGAPEQPVEVEVTDREQSTWLTIKGTDVFEGSDQLTLVASVSNPPRTDVEVILNTRDRLVIPAGASETELLLPVRENDVYQNPETNYWTIERATGGEFEHLDYSNQPFSVQTLDSPDPVLLSLTGPEDIVEGEDLVYTVSVEAEPRLPLLVRLQNGREVTLEPGRAATQIRVRGAPNTPYVDAHERTMAIVHYEGGGYEQLMLGQGSVSRPVVTRIADRTESTRLLLAASDVIETAETLTVWARLAIPTSTAAEVALDGGEIIHIPAGESAGQTQIPVRANDVYINPEAISRSVVAVGGGGFEQVDYTNAAFEVKVLESGDPVWLTLNADETVEEGGEITYRATLSEPPQTPVRVMLSNQHEMLFASNEQSVSIRVDAPQDTVYEDANEVRTYVISAEGGNFENLVLGEGHPEQPVVTQVTDVVTPITARLTVEDLYEGEGPAIARLTLPYPVATPARVALSTGDEIHLEPGQRVAEGTIAVRPNDVYRHQNSRTIHAVAFAGGGFESVSLEQAQAEFTVFDKPDPVVVTLRAPSQISAGELLTYEVELSATPLLGVGINLSNGEFIRIPAGSTLGSVQVTAPPASPYGPPAPLAVAVTNAVGGHFESLTVEQGAMERPVITEIVQEPRPIEVSLSIQAVAEQAVLTVTLGAPSQGPVTVRLNSGHQLTADDGERTMTQTVNQSDLGRALEAVRIDTIEGGGFETVQIENSNPPLPLVTPTAAEDAPAEEETPDVL